MVEQYGRVGSLFPHNVAMISLGDDFRFSHEMEWEQQYTNYNKLFSYINSRTDLHVEVRFGTVADYFKEIAYRMKNSDGQLPTLVGDFFPYGDVYAECKYTRNFTYHYGYIPSYLNPLACLRI